MTELADSVQRKGRATDRERKGRAEKAERGRESYDAKWENKGSAQHVGAALLRYDRLVVR